MKQFKILFFVFIFLFVVSGCSDQQTITFDTNGGNTLEKIEVKAKKDIILPTPEKEGYAFDGWYNDDLLSDPFVVESLGDENIKLFAKWLIKSYHIQFDSNGGDDVTTLTLDYQQVINLPNPFRSGYAFLGWFTDEELLEPFELTVMPASDVTLYAKWVLSIYTISFVTNSDDVINDVTYSIEDDLSQVIPSRDDYYFKGWYLDQMLTIPFDIDILQEHDVTLYAKWQISYEVMYQHIMESDSYTIEIENEPLPTQIIEVDGYTISIAQWLYKEYVYYDEEKDTIYQLIPMQEFASCNEKSIFPIPIEPHELVEIFGSYKELLPNTFDMSYLSNDGSVMFVSTKYLRILNDTHFENVLGFKLDKFGMSFNDQELILILASQKNDVSITVKFKLINQTSIDLPLNYICKDETYVQGVTDTTILIGNTVPTSGFMASLGVPYLSGMNAYINYINETGGVNGRQIELIHYDDQFDSTLGLAHVETLVEVDEVFAIVGHFGKQTIESTYPFIKQIGIPTVYLTSQLIDIVSDYERVAPNFFPVIPSYRFAGHGLANIMFSEETYGANFDQALQSGDRIGIIYESSYNIYRSGLTFRVLDFGASYTQIDVTSPDVDLHLTVTQLKELGVKSVVVLTSGSKLATILSHMQLENLNVPVFIPNEIASPANVNDIAYNFPIFGQTWIDINSEKGMAEFESFLDIMENYGESIYMYNPYAMSGYMAAYIFIEGLKQVEDAPLTWASYIQAMESQPVNIPMAGFVDYENNNRIGTEYFGLLKYNSITNTFDYYREIEYNQR
ncbi:MAG: InlB B-repeat-containing protein [Acholeplasmataceae bacterium]|jgi:uncharacterized repeat protein (TIGR02543 family)|nr:InlB B-repeat-containing protein [Acholeplasmataceae bacterium]